MSRGKRFRWRSYRKRIIVQEIVREVHRSDANGGFDGEGRTWNDAVELVFHLSVLKFLGESYAAKFVYNNKNKSTFLNGLVLQYKINLDY